MFGQTGNFKNVSSVSEGVRNYRACGRSIFFSVARNSSGPWLHNTSFQLIITDNSARLINDESITRKLPEIAIG